MSTTTHLNLDLRMFASHRAPRLLTVMARLDGFQLDRALAAGDDPAAGPLLAARAELICRYGQRELLAHRLAEIARDDSRYGLGTRVRPSRAAARAARPELFELAAALERPGPAVPRGVAAARLLLTDPAGPLYPPARGRSLALRARAALHALRARSFSGRPNGHARTG